MYLILTGGSNDSDFFNTILEYDITGDSYTQIGTMIEDRHKHAISVVQYSDFSEHCQ